MLTLNYMLSFSKHKDKFTFSNIAQKIVKVEKLKSFLMEYEDLLKCLNAKEM